jgi:UDP-N-acetylglucosamine--N-acetylmuramyl-(pentapeptide) pyrophosphoryl-undecaprenol N-acetylglucosamine transferase
MEADLVRRERIPFATIPAAGLHGVGLRSLPRNLFLLARGFVQSAAHLRAFRPDVLFLTGGYLAAPMAAAGRAIPTMLFVPDIEPGLALKFLARFADRIAVTAPESQRFFRKKVAVTGYPVRAELGAWTRERGRAALKLRDDLPVLLVAGGSKGARSINEAVLAHLPSLLHLTQVVHLTGEGEWERVTSMTSGLAEAELSRYRPFPYLHERMGAALAAADLALMRAGASVLGELPSFGLPAILVPYPHAWRYQQVNAEHLASRGAAIVLKNEDMQRDLLGTVSRLLQSTSERKTMRSAMKSMAKPKAAGALAAQLLELGGQQP